MLATDVVIRQTWLQIIAIYDHNAGAGATAGPAKREREREGRNRSIRSAISLCFSVVKYVELHRGTRATHPAAVSVFQRFVLSAAAGHALHPPICISIYFLQFPKVLPSFLPDYSYLLATRKERVCCSCCTLKLHYSFMPH